MGLVHLFLLRAIKVEAQKIRVIWMMKDSNNWRAFLKCYKFKGAIYFWGQAVKLRSHQTPSSSPALLTSSSRTFGSRFHVCSLSTSFVTRQLEVNLYAYVSKHFPTCQKLAAILRKNKSTVSMKNRGTAIIKNVFACVPKFSERSYQSWSRPKLRWLIDLAYEILTKC